MSNYISEREYSAIIPPNEGFVVSFGYKDETGEKALVIKDGEQREIASIGMDGVIDLGSLTQLDTIKVLYRLYLMFAYNGSVVDHLPAADDLKMKVS